MKFFKVFVPCLGIGCAGFLGTSGWTQDVTRQLPTKYGAPEPVRDNRRMRQDSDAIDLLEKLPVNGPASYDSAPTRVAIPPGSNALPVPAGQMLMRMRRIPVTVHRIVHELIPAEELQQHRVVQTAIETLKRARSDDEKRKAAAALAEHLVQQFDDDLAQRESELASVEERLNTLRKQLEKRKASKEEIINLRLKTIINNAEGLGFPGDDGLSIDQSGMIDGDRAFRGPDLPPVSPESDDNVENGPYRRVNSDR